MIKDFITLIYPKNCVACYTPLVKGEEHVCMNCILELPETDFQTPVLGETLSNLTNSIHQKFEGKLPIRYGLAYFYYKKTTRVQRILHQIKYREGSELGYQLGNQYGQLLKEAAPGFCDLILPVPLHKNKLKKRGFNQAERIAAGVADATGIELREDILIRKTYTRTQTHKSRVDRWQNVKNVFGLSGDLTKSCYVQDKDILIIDDVITTGSTIEACARPLLEAGAKSVSVLCLAVAE